MLFVVANSVPMLSLTAVGHQASTTVIGGAQQLWHDGREAVAALVLFTAVVAPGLQIGLMLAIVLGARRPRPRRWVAALLRHHPSAATWSMIEVMIIGVLVALIKIADYATVTPGVALFALGGLVFLLAGIQASFDPREVLSVGSPRAPPPGRSADAARAAARNSPCASPAACSAPGPSSSPRRSVTSPPTCCRC